ncbi:MAG: cytochrome ubiquinol oxidase subunit I [Planctomycetota bacterium]
MDDLLSARSQMAMSLGFHILFAVAGMAMPLMMATAEILHLRTGRAVYLDLAKRWAKGTAILFAVGAVSGTTLSFELGLLWPEFMRHAGPIVGMPFSLEAFAFFLEAIFLGIYLYGWKKLLPHWHIVVGFLVALCGLTSGVFVVAVNSWMNTPTGFDYVDGEFVNIDVWKAFLSPAFPTQAFHTAISAYSSVAFLVMGIHAWGLMRSPKSEFHRAALTIALGFAMVSTPLQILSGDLAARHCGNEQPIKLAAMEGLYETQRGAPLALGGIPDDEARHLKGAIEIPKVLSLMQGFDPEHEVRGLEDFPRDEWPNTLLVRTAFSIMVMLGMAMMGVVGWSAFLIWRRRELPTGKWYLRALVAMAPAGMIAVEAGWCVTELGRQPWIIHGYMRTSEALTTVPNLVWHFGLFTVLYVFLGITVTILLRNHVFAAPASGAEKKEGR